MAAQPESDDRGTDIELTCPVPDCSRSFDSAPALFGHVGHHDDGWGRARKTPVEVKLAATAADSEASKRVAKVLAYLAHHDVRRDAVTVFYDHSYGTVQIQYDGAMSDAEWQTFRDATGQEGIQYVGGDRSYCTEAFVEELPPAPTAGECEVGGCDRDGPEVTQATTPGGEIATLCPYHRKEFWGVSS